MRIAVNRDKCEGHGMCEALAGAYFEVDGGGKSTITGDPDDGLGELVLSSCPVTALSRAAD